MTLAVAGVGAEISGAMRAVCADQVGRVVLRALSSGSGGVITVDVDRPDRLSGVTTSLQRWLLATAPAFGSVSATISPEFVAGTYRSMLALVRALNDAGAGDLWKPEGSRSLRLGGGVHVFVSVDRPVSDDSPAPNSFLEVVSAHRIRADWFDARVGPRCGGGRLVRLLYGVPGVSGSIFERERLATLSGRRGDDGRVHLSLIESRVAVEAAAV